MANSSPKARVVLQQCTKAKLRISSSSENDEAVFIEIGRGILVYISFFHGASEDIINKIAKSIMNVKLCESANGMFVSILDLPGDVLIIPQASLGGKLKGKAVQYHTNIAKELGSHLYKLFVDECHKIVDASEKCKESGVSVKCGIYGSRQVLSVETNGPFTHLFNF